MIRQKKKRADDRNSVLREFREELSLVLDGHKTEDQRLDDLLWELLVCFQGQPFYTARQLEFTYVVRGKEIFISRKEKSITQATVLLAFHNALQYRKRSAPVTGPKKLGTFGASYLYAIFLCFGVI